MRAGLCHFVVYYCMNVRVRFGVLYNTEIVGETIQTFVFVDFEAAQVENEDMKTNIILHFLS